MNKPIEEQTLVERLRIRASIRRNNTERKSVQEGKPDRISDLLEEAASMLETYEDHLALRDGHIDYQNRAMWNLVEYNKELERKLNELE
jgi:hypothetical protein